jgi:TRAP-type C4-dicarboxylate transport system permease small subunit
MHYKMINTLLSIFFIILSVWYSHHLTKDFINEKTLLLRVSIMLVVVMLSMWIIDIVIMSNIKLLRDTTKDEILSMVKYLFIGIVVLYVYNENKK